VIDRVLSKSYITALSSEDQDKIKLRVEEILKNGEGLKWIREDEGIFGKYLP
jgi:hypothetical protein